MPPQERDEQDARQARAQNVENVHTGRGLSPADEDARQRKLQSVRSVLHGIGFPTTREHLLDEVGDVRIFEGPGREVTMRQALQPVRQDRFESQDELLDQLDRAGSLR